MAEDRVDVVTRAIAGFGLPDVAEPGSTQLPDHRWPSFLSRVRRERITGLAVESEAAGWLALSEAQASQLHAAHRDAMLWCLCVERKLLALADAFDAEDLPFVVLKGPSVAHTMYADPCLRAFADLDVLVAARDYQRACRLLRHLGHLRRQPEPRRGFDVRFGRASVHTHPDDRVEVDLHRTPGWGPFSQWIDAEELLDRKATFALGGRRIARLDDTGMLLTIAMHASLGARSPKLVPLRDVLQVMTGGDVDRDVLARWAREWHLTAVLRHALATASAVLVAPLPPGAGRFLGEPAARRDRRALLAYTEGRARGGTAIATLRAVPGVRGKAAYARALLLPDRAFLGARVGVGGFAHLRRWGVPMRWVKARVTGVGPGTAMFLPSMSGRRSAGGWRTLGGKPTSTTRADGRR
jgi:hypothetical protein